MNRSIFKSFAFLAYSRLEKWSLVIVLMAMASLQLHSQPAKKVVMGVPPETLLPMLPPPPRDWKLLSSIGTNEISACPALLTFAIRDYRFDPLPPKLPGDLVLPPKLTKITLIDTANDPDRAFVFDAFRETDEAGPNLKRFNVEGIPFIEQIVTGSLRILSGAFDRRFIISATLENQTDEDRDAWLAALNVAALNAWMKKAPELPPTPDFFKVSRIDELNPKTNQTLTIAYLTDAQRQVEEKKAQLDGERENARQKKLGETENRQNP